MLLNRASTTVFSRKKQASLEIFLDNDFDGIMYGLPEESLGCRLKGKVVLKNLKALSVRYLVFMFLGKISVACGPAVSADYNETQTIYRKQCVFHSSETSGKKIPAGVHEYCFDFDLPGHLPPSFKRVRGKIEYACYAILARPIFRNDLTIKKIVTLNRCLTDSISPLQQLNSNGGIFDDRASYHINTPITAYREGGLVTAEITLKTSDPHIVVESIEYGLKEEINYRTTNEHVMSLVTSIDENIFPLGKKKITLDRFPHNTSESLKISFHLCPWVNCDVDSELIYIEHKIALTIVVSEETDSLFDDIDDDDSYLSTPQINYFPLPPISDRSSISLSQSHDDVRSNRSRSARTHSLLPPRRNSSDEFSTPTTSNRRTLSLLSSNLKRLSFNNISIRRNLDDSLRRERKSYDLEIPLIVTTKSGNRQVSQQQQQRQQQPENQLRQQEHHIPVDEPPTYAMATIVPPPPAYDDEDDEDDYDDDYDDDDDDE